MKKKTKKKLLLVVIAVFLAAAALYLLGYYNLLPKKYYKAEDFGIVTIKSSKDYNCNGIDDYTDILLGARKDAKNKPRYDSAYYVGGYPPDDIGVCTDVIWRALENAGYSLKDMVDKDIAENKGAYSRIEEPDPNIDFRRVSNLIIFFERNTLSLTTDPYEINQWQPGDIVTYGTVHIAIVSDKRNQDGIPYIIHNSGQPVREEDALVNQEISGHFRFELK